uniref:Gamma-interferon inducible lysosomal thiol reductase n=1 Tax=Amblyomma maculatum TaxID=34609 RepID=G3MKP8_AMBMU
MGAAAETEQRKKKRPFGPFVVKYVCLAVCLVVLVILAFAMAYPLGYLYAKPAVMDNATENADVECNKTGDLASDGLKSTPPQTTPSLTTRTPTDTTQSTVAPTKVITTTPATKATSSKSATSTGGNGLRRPKHVNGPSSTNDRKPSDEEQELLEHHESSSSKEDVSGKKITLQLVYDCYCPRSRQFIVSQLLPVYEKLRDHLNLTLIPSSGVRNETAGNKSSADVECKASSKECHSSMLETCVMTRTNETLTAVKVIACMSSSVDPLGVGRTCVEEYGVEWDMVQLCVTERGKLYMLELSQKVWRITGGVGRMPLLSLQGKTTHVVEVEAETNLLELVCDHMHHGHEACPRSRNGTAISTPGDGPRKETVKKDDATIGRP